MPRAAIEIREHVDPVDAKKEVLAKLLPNFLRHRAEDVVRLRAALAAGDFESIAVIGHNLRGNGASYGFPQLSAVGATIEQSARARDAEAIARDIEHLAAETAKLQSSIGEK